MFEFHRQFNMNHQCMSNPFGATFLNPKINFNLGLAAATIGTPVYSPTNSVFMPPAQTSMPATRGYTGYNNFGNFNFNFNFNSSQTPQYDFSNYFKNFGGNISGAGTSYNTTFPGIDNFKFNLSGSVNNNSEVNSFNPTGKKLALNSDAYGPKFLEKVKQIAKKLNCDYRDLLGLMNSESNMNSQATNSNGGATGLIQFMPDTAKSLGTTTTALKNMTPLEQLDYVERFLTNAKAKAGFSSNDKLSAGDLYTLTFLPARAKREVLTQTGENYYNANKGLDSNKDGKITKTELAQRIKGKYVSDNSFLA